MKNLLLSILFLISVSGYSQSFYVPGGTSGIGSNGGGYVWVPNNFGVGTSAPSNVQGWSKVLDVRGSTDSKIIATTSGGIRTGVYSHSSWNGGGGFIGTETDHNLFFITNYSPKMVIGNGGSVGIGTTTPEAKFTISQIGNGWNDGLRINRDATNYLTLTEDVTDIRLKNWGAGGIRLFTSVGEAATITNSGNFGIGTTAPGLKLVVQGLGGGNVDLAVNGRIVTGDASNLGGVWIAGPGNMFMGQVSTTAMGWYNNGAWRLIADNNGNVGIGTTNPNQKLTVNGTIYGKEVKVDLSVPGPDYVFDKDYKLTSLEDIKTYIDQHKHLPEVPSAKEMDANGINLGEMNMMLLKKVEELTLHLIQQGNEMKELKKENEKQNRTINLLINKDK